LQNKTAGPEELWIADLSCYHSANSHKTMGLGIVTNKILEKKKQFFFAFVRWIFLKFVKFTSLIWSPNRQTHYVKREVFT
jgi:hypothetical protein